MNTRFDVTAAQKCITEAVALVDQGVNEEVLRQRFAGQLPRMFPDDPWWALYHALGSEHRVKFAKKGQKRGGFVDALVGLTAIEYERDISNGASFTHGLEQVKDYCAGLLNGGAAPDLILGVLSDTVHWRSYRIASVAPVNKAAGELFGRDHIQLTPLDVLDAHQPDKRTACLLGEFLCRHLGREGARPLGAETLARDLGFESTFCDRHIAALRRAVTSAFASNRKYAGLIEKLWCDFVAYVGEDATNLGFDADIYGREFYLVTLAKLLCANVIAEASLVSGETELRNILNGAHFRLKGFANLVEYDYFGWLNEDPHVAALLPIAQAMQDDLRAYDFRSPPVEDLFGTTMAQLAKRTQRILLGQEWTPSWLAAALVSRVFQTLPQDEDPRLVDMCCGSGAMIVEAVKLAKARLDAGGIPHDASYVSRLAHAVTGFDVDPLAVMLSKVGWVVAARDRLRPLGAFQVSIPIYHADSLFTTTPLSKTVESQSGARRYDLVLDDRSVGLPAFLISPNSRALFDALLTGAYTIAMESARDSAPSYSESDISSLLKQSEVNSGIFLPAQDRVMALSFCRELIESLDALQRDGRNGIWAFVLRNSYRPSLVAGLFNGLVSNPPWLALSKIADNPYKAALRRRAHDYGITPAGPSHLHIELATIFLVHSIDRYLRPNAVIGSILPETVLSGHHHNPFRQGAFLDAHKSVPLHLDEIWRVEKGTFKNEAIVFFGRKTREGTLAPATIPGYRVGSTARTPLAFRQLVQGKRVAWSDQLITGRRTSGFFNPALFRQGADVMPRTVIFHDTSPARSRQWRLAPIDRQQSPFRYLVADAKRNKTFVLPPCVVPDRYVFDVLLSNHLTPFDIASPAKAFLPIAKGSAGNWRPISETSLATYTAAREAFHLAFSAIGPRIGPSEFFAMLDSKRGKLSSQAIPIEGWLVFMGAGGDYVCAAHAAAASYVRDKLIVDQTLYWSAVPTEDEALYLTGLLNSDAINAVIKEFQPRGQFGARHVHKLPLGVTPKYDSADAAHADVVAKTRLIVAEWNSRKASDSEMAGLLDPNRSLPQRRRRLRESLRAVPRYDEYALACRCLYGV